MNMKKLISLALALVLMLAMAVPAFAAGEGSITIKNTVVGVDYSVYKIFDLESYSEDKTAYSYKIAEDSEWNAFVTGTGEGAAYVIVDENGYVTWNTDKNTAADVADFATKALAYAEANSIEATDSKTANGDTVEFTGLDLGYYLVDSSLGALCGLTTTEPAAEVNEKNAGHTLDKKVQEDSTGNWGDENDASVGETVNFRATITISGPVINLVMHDTMTDGLDFTGVTGITLNDTPVDAANYTVNAPAADGCTFDVVFAQAFNNTLKSGDVIVVSYQAVLNEKAVVAEAEENKSNLTYDDTNGNSHETPEDETKTFTWEMPVLKYANGDTNKPLAGAKFVLYTDEGCTQAVKLHDKGGNIYQVCVDANCAEEHVSEITTTSNGTFTIEGLDAGTYYLKETEAPAGYNKLDTVVEVVIDHEGKINAVDKNDDGDTDDEGESFNVVGVNNNAGTQLPSTGGMGTTMFYAMGSLMVAAAVVLLVVKRRMNAAE